MCFAYTCDSTQTCNRPSHAASGWDQINNTLSLKRILVHRYGIKAAVYAPAPGCVIKADGCKVLMVKANDESRDCMTGEKVLNTQ